MVSLLWFLLVCKSCMAKTDLLFASINGHLTDTRLDPLVNPGDCSTHVHSVFGSGSFSNNVRARHVRNNNWDDIDSEASKVNQTTCNIIPNLSMYWAPSMYIRNPKDGRFHIVPSFSLSYYRIIFRDDRSIINPFPDYLRFVVGDATRREKWQPGEPRGADISWTLLTKNRRTANSIDHGDWEYLRNGNVEIGDYIEMNVKFPNCLRRLTSTRLSKGNPGFRSHGAYTQSNQLCPEGFDYPIPMLNLEVRYNIGHLKEVFGDPTGAIVQNVSNWRLSTGDASGAGAHADFISGWNQDLMRDILKFCTKDHKDIPGATQECPVKQYFKTSNGQEKRRTDMQRKSIDTYMNQLQEDVSIVDTLPIGKGNCLL